MLARNFDKAIGLPGNILSVIMANTEFSHGTLGGAAGYSSEVMMIIEDHVQLQPMIELHNK